jgi:hypothetical protein
LIGHALNHANKGRPQVNRLALEPAANFSSGFD